MTFGEKVQSLRKQKGMSQEELAEKLSVTRQTISKWELDQSTPDLEFIAQLSDILGATTDYLIKNVSEESAENINEKSNADDKAPRPDISSQEKVRHSHFLWFIGITATILGAAAVIIFVILSVVNPWTTMNKWGTFTGLLGYLFGSGAMPYFIIGCISLLFGVIICGFAAYRKG